MGDMADDAINGFTCESCGQIIDYEEPGYPRKCADCKPKRKRRRRKRNSPGAPGHKARGSRG